MHQVEAKLRQVEAQVLDSVLHTGTAGGKLPGAEALRGTAAAEMAEKLAGLAGGAGTPAEKLGYTARTLPLEDKKTYDRPAIEELIRWRLWDRTGAGLMAELGSHQLDAASIFIAAAHAATDRPTSIRTP